MQNLVDLEKAFHGGRLKACFDGGEMFITLEGGNLFEPGSMFKPLDSVDRVRELLTDFAPYSASWMLSLSVVPVKARCATEIVQMRRFGGNSVQLCFSDFPP